MQGVFLLVNFGDRPHATGGMLEAFERVLRDRGETFRIERSRSIEHGNQLVEEAWNAGFHRFIVGGGDGTLNVVLNHPRARELTLGVIPLGTVNALARTLGMERKRPVEALEKQLAAEPGRALVGRVEDRRFLCFSSVGYDAEVVHRARGRIKRVLRRGAFGAVGLWEGMRLGHLPRFAYKVDDDPPGHANLFVLSNIECYAGLDLFSTHVSTPGFQGFGFDGRSFGSLLRMAWEAAKGPPMDWVVRLPAARGFADIQRLQIRSVRPVAVQIDGEAYTPTDPCRLEFRTEPEGQQFLLPPGG